MNWKDKIEEFEVVDVRKSKKVFLQWFLKKAKTLEVGKGICIVQIFEPKPLYKSMEKMGYEHFCERISAKEYHTYFYKKDNDSHEEVHEMPLKPTSLLNYKNIDDDLISVGFEFWQLIWDKKEAAIDLRIKLMLSLSNAIGAGRYRQASRELIKTYSLGTKVEELDELFALFVWNQGFGNFSSEIMPSAPFKIYQLIKNKEKEGLTKEEVVKELLEKFGENNPDVKKLRGRYEKSR